MVNFFLALPATFSMSHYRQRLSDSQRGSSTFHCHQVPFLQIFVMLLPSATRPASRFCKEGHVLAARDTIAADAFWGSFCRRRKIYRRVCAAAVDNCGGATTVAVVCA